MLVGMLGGGTVFESVVVEQLFTDDGGESAMSSTANVARTDIARGSMAGLSQNGYGIILNIFLYIYIYIKNVFVYLFIC